MNKTIYPPLTAQQTTALLILLGSFTDPVSISTAKTLRDTLQQYYDKKEKADAMIWKHPSKRRRKQNFMPQNFNSKFLTCSRLEILQRMKLRLWNSSSHLLPQLVEKEFPSLTML